MFKYEFLQTLLLNQWPNISSRTTFLILNHHFGREVCQKCTENVKIGVWGYSKTPSRERERFRNTILSTNRSTVLNILESITYISSYEMHKRYVQSLHVLWSWRHKTHLWPSVLDIIAISGQWLNNAGYQGSIKLTDYEYGFSKKPYHTCWFMQWVPCYQEGCMYMLSLRMKLMLKSF